MRDTTQIDDRRLAKALMGLLSHDLRSPLGSVMLALSSIEEDRHASADVKALASIGAAQAGRVTRLIDAVLSAGRGPRAPVARPADLSAITCDAMQIYHALGGTGDVTGPRVPIKADVGQLQDAIVNLIECVGGDGGRVSASVTRDDTGARVALTGVDADAVPVALAAREPHDRRSAFALGAAAVIRGHGGTVAPSYDGVVILLEATT